MADIRYDACGSIFIDSWHVERKDLGVQMKTDIVQGATVYLGEVYREQLTVYLTHGNKVQATCEIPVIDNESVLKLGERMSVERMKVLRKMADSVAQVVGNKED